MRPLCHSAIMFIAMCGRPMWTKVLVSNRHDCPPVVRGPKSAPHRMRLAEVGASALTPFATIATKTATFRTIMVGVTHARGVRVKSARRNSSSEAAGGAAGGAGGAGDRSYVIERSLDYPRRGRRAADPTAAVN